MTTYLIVTVGQTDVQLVEHGCRYRLKSATCGILHDQIISKGEEHWKVIDAPVTVGTDDKTGIPDGDIELCTPKLDPVLDSIDPISLDQGLIWVLIFETTRTNSSDPRHAGNVVERRIRDRMPGCCIQRVAFLKNEERLESNEIGESVVRHAIVSELANSIWALLAGSKPDDEIHVATTGGFPAVNELINEMVQLYAHFGAKVRIYEVPEKRQQNSKAVELTFQPSASYQARWHALKLVERGNLLGAEGAVQHLIDKKGQDWTKVIQQLALFASSRPLMPGPILPHIDHECMAVRSALRVELALRAGDIPRAVHGTVAFREAALWDHIDADSRLKRVPSPKGRRYRFDPGALATLQARHPSLFADPKKPRAVPFVEMSGNPGEYEISTDQAAMGRLLKRFWDRNDQLPHFKAYYSCEQRHNIRGLRNDVAHDEPTPAIMANAESTMIGSTLWSGSRGFLCQPLVQNVLCELGIKRPQALLEELLHCVRQHLRRA